MGSRLTEIVVDSHDPVAQAAFWSAALDYHVVRTEEGQVEIAAWEREPPDLAEQVRQAPMVPATWVKGHNHASCSPTRKAVSSAF